MDGVWVPVEHDIDVLRLSADCVSVCASDEVLPQPVSASSVAARPAASIRFMCIEKTFFRGILSLLRAPAHDLLFDQGEDGDEQDGDRRQHDNGGKDTRAVELG